MVSSTSIGEVGGRGGSGAGKQKIEGFGRDWMGEAEVTVMIRC